MTSNAYKKAERLRSKKVIEGLFSRGKSAFEYPVRLRWIETSDETEIPARVLVTVSKKNLKKAVHRNKVKRRLREAYRINKQELIDSLVKSGRKIAVAFIYVGRDTGNYNDIEQKIIKLINRLIQYNERDFR